MTFRDHTELASGSVRGPLRLLDMREKILSIVRKRSDIDHLCKRFYRVTATHGHRISISYELNGEP
jgi:hypothetical protein